MTARKRSGRNKSRMPCNRRSPIVADNRRFLDAQSIQQTHHVADEMQKGVLLDCFRPIRSAVAAHVRRNCMEAGGREGGHLLEP